MLRRLAFAAQPFLRNASPGMLRCYSNVVEITPENYDSEVVECEVPVIVDCYATWCGPCQMLIPTLEKVVEEHDGAVKLAKIDVDENLEIAMQYQVSAVPAVFAVINDKIVDSFVGAKSEDDFRDFLDSVLDG